MILKSLQQKITSLFILLCLLFINSAEALKVITSNLLHEHAYDLCLKTAAEKGKAAEKVVLDHRNKKFKAFLKREKADIICLQEFHDQSWKAVVQEFAQENDYTLLKELNPDERDGLKTKLGILVNNKTIEPKGRTYTHKHAKIMSQRCKDKKTNTEFVVFNIHAPWGQGGTKKDQTEEYKKCIKYAENLPIVAVGDWNTDGNPDQNKNKQIFLNDVFAATDGFEDISDSLPHTARSIHDMDDAQKIDYVVTRGFKKPVSVTTEPPHSPQGFNLLLPHTDNSKGTTTFDPQSPENHWSDHAAIIVDFDAAPQPAAIKAEEPTKKDTKEEPKKKNNNGNKPAGAAQKKQEFEHKGKVLLGTTGITMAYAVYQLCEKKLKGKEFSATEYAKTFITSFAELATVRHSIKTTEQKLFSAALTALVGGGILLNRG